MFRSVSHNHRQALIISLGCFGATALYVYYATLYFKVFLDKYHLPSNYLNYVQVLFLVWNAINDPILGYMQDLGCCGINWIRDRRKVMLYGGPVFAATFLLFWFPWSTSVPIITAAQLLTALFLFDTLFTLVLSAYCGLCVEKAPTHADRVRITVYGELFGLFAGFLIFPIESVTHNLDYFGTFQICCVTIAVISAATMVFCGVFISKDAPEIAEKKKMTTSENEGGWHHVLQISWQIVKQPRFIALVGGQFFKMLRFMGNEQFLLIFVESLLVEHNFLERGSAYLGLYYVLVRSFGSIFFLALWYPVNKLGCHSVLHVINVLTLFNCFAMYFIGRNNHLWMAIFLLLENTFSRCGQHGYYMIIAGEVIDSDKRRYDRVSPLSTTIFTLKALFSKPADQLAPIIMLSLLERGRYILLKDQCISTDATSITTTTVSSILPEDCNGMFSSMFTAMVFFPVFCALAESFFLFIDQIARRKEPRNTVSDLHIEMQREML